MREPYKGTSKVYEMIPLEQLRQLQRRFPKLRRIKREV